MTGATTSETPKWVYAIGLIPTIWVAILIAPSVNGGIPQIIKDFPQIIESPFNLSWCNDSLKVILIFILGHKGEYVAVVGGGCKDKFAILECVFNCFCHIFSCKVAS